MKEPEKREAARPVSTCLECSRALFQAPQVVSWAVVSSLLCPTRPPPTPVSAQVLPATRRPALQGSGSISPDGQARGTLGRPGPQCPCRVLPAWEWGQLGSSWGFQGLLSGLQVTRRMARALTQGAHGPGRRALTQLRAAPALQSHRMSPGSLRSSQPRHPGPLGATEVLQDHPSPHPQPDRCFSMRPWRTSQWGWGVNVAKGPAVPEMGAVSLLFPSGLGTHSGPTSSSWRRAAEGRAGWGGNRRGPESISAPTQTRGGGCSLLSDRRPVGNGKEEKKLLRVSVAHQPHAPPCLTEVTAYCRAGDRRRVRAPRPARGEQGQGGSGSPGGLWRVCGARPGFVLPTPHLSQNRRPRFLPASL